MKIVIATLLLLAVTLLGLVVLMFLDRRADRAEWERLEALQPEARTYFAHELLAGLPEPARRYFAFAIQQGTPLLPVSVIEMSGQFSLGSKDDPRYQPMQARQILAAPEGFVWAMRTTGGMPVAGSDTGRWTRFRVFGLVPVARAGGDPDHARSAFGRYVSEAVIWAPAALLPGPGVIWTSVDANTARVTVRHDTLTQMVDVTVDDQGRPQVVSFDRWTNANPERTFRLQPFGAVMSDFREVAGYRLPFHVEAGNMFGTEEYFPFFVANVTGIRFPGHRP
jgi:hypothetical protein